MLSSMAVPSEFHQQQKSQDGGYRQPEVYRGSTGRPLSVGGRLGAGARSTEGGRAVEPASSNVTRVATTNMHMHVAELPVDVILEKVRSAWTIHRSKRTSSLFATIAKRMQQHSGRSGFQPRFRGTRGFCDDF